MEVWVIWVLVIVKIWNFSAIGCVWTSAVACFNVTERWCHFISCRIEFPTNSTESKRNTQFPLLIVPFYCISHWNYVPFPRSFFFEFINSITCTKYAFHSISNGKSWFRLWCEQFVRNVLRFLPQIIHYWRESFHLCVWTLDSPLCLCL